MKGPFTPLRENLPAAYAGSVKLAKLAGLIPATIVRQIEEVPAGVLSISLGDIFSYDQASVGALELVTRARVPLAGAEKTELAAFRAKDGGPEHLAIIINAPSPSAPVLTRLHSECLTGDLLASPNSIWAAQLRGAAIAFERCE